MRLSTTDIYSFQALGYLGMQELDRWVSSDEISEHTGIARPYLVRILALLSSKNIIKSKKGIGGGYALARKPHLVSLCEVVRAVDGPVAPLSCISLNWHEDCPEEPRCFARNRIWRRIRDAVLEVLGEMTVADLVQDFKQGNNYSYCLGHLLRPNV
ncbi:Rrf2 family transcriptional regulator [Deinococcus cellulosilyticus]|uniref:Rrf2 family transcriptional regulator n=1 Tax=Deinococcus cellulosilyticus (strain DSM 18568 / NBRC 106333 / KACC 11606 / 5516J-15) TaxID=1223518 RepID=A0A511MXY8_DEIC1|nr:RrF2 family transcriptional regulator [Deinococcus cellulosilyticus]GEM45440.1 Rrf2 family transcriptional regulator [Deinococcus cellulosilyticus NBRC 106333 = KACC 11606]